MQILKAHAQWASRPSEERYWDMPEMLAACRKARNFAAEATVKVSDLRVEAADDEIRLIGSQGVPANISHFAFGQLSARAKAPPSYLRSLPPTLAAQNLNHGLKNAEADSARLLFHNNGSLVLRAATSEKYARVWNAEILERLMDVLPQGWRVPPARPVGQANERTRTATAEDVSRLSQHLGLAVREGDTIAPAGLYASDKDMFLFLINEENPISDGTEHPLFRGIMLWNSEVGDMSLGGMGFLLKGTCGNHIVWDAKSVFEFNLRHVGTVRDRASSKLDVQIKKYADDSTDEQHAMIEMAKNTVIAATKDEVVTAVLDFARAKKILGLTQTIVADAFDKADEHRDWYGVSPTTVYGIVNGLTEVSQKQTHTDDRVALDRASGRVLQMSF